MKSSEMVNPVQFNMNKKSQKKHGVLGILSEFKENHLLYLMSIPGIIYLIIFCYIPLVFIVIAFKRYNIQDGFFGSPWIGLDNFKFFFSSASKVWQTTYNTITLNISFIIAGLIIQMSLAILLNEIKNKHFKKVSQSLFFIPYFLSWVVIGSIIYNLFSSEYGAVNGLLKGLGFSPINWYMHPEYWKPILIGAHIWKWSGYGSLIYMSAMAGFDNSYYEAAYIDGATRFQSIKHITIPLLKPTATILVLFNIGRILFGDFGMVYGIVRDVGPLLQTTEVIDTYVFRAMRQTGDFSLTAAIGIYQSFFGFIIVLLSNKIAKRLNDGTALF